MQFSTHNLKLNILKFKVEIFILGRQRRKWFDWSKGAKSKSGKLCITSLLIFEQHSIHLLYFKHFDIPSRKTCSTINVGMA